MGWTYTRHECQLPPAERCRSMGYMPGSIWDCTTTLTDGDQCTRRWRYEGHGRYFTGPASWTELIDTAYEPPSWLVATARNPREVSNGAEDPDAEAAAGDAAERAERGA